MFITNNSQESSLYSELLKKIPYTGELKILVGYFYFSGLKDFLREIFKNEQLRLQILVGMNADVFNGCIVEYEENLKEQTPIIIKKNFKDSLKKIFV